ncbi:hypothetical protein D3C86_2254550 [compost metagenome]
MQIGFIKHYPFTVTPAVTFAIHFDKAAVVIRGDQPQVIAQRTGIRVTVAWQAAAMG